MSTVEEKTRIVLENLETRRSVRSYRAEQITDEELNAVLRAGTFAPTGMNRQSPVIVAVQDPLIRNTLATLNASVLGGTSDPFYGAPTVVVALADPSVGTWQEDGSLVLGNMMNAAHALGLGSCWIHRARQVFEMPEGKHLLRSWGLPDTLVGVGNCILGYPDGPLPEARPRKENYTICIK